MDGIYTEHGPQLSMALEQTYLMQRLVDDLRLLALVETRQLAFDIAQSFSHDRRPECKCWGAVDSDFLIRHSQLLVLIEYELRIIDGFAIHRILIGNKRSNSSRRICSRRSFPDPIGYKANTPHYRICPVTFYL